MSLTTLAIAICLGGFPNTSLKQIEANSLTPVWQTLLVIKAESNFKPGAVSSANAKGLMQLTPIGLKEAQRQCHLGPGDLKNPTYNVRAGSCLLRYYIDYTGDFYLGLIVYNSGYKGLTRYQETGRMYKETWGYIERIQKYEKKCSHLFLGEDL